MLIGLRDTLRQKNLHDTNVAPAPNRRRSTPTPSAVLTTRTPDGTYNDLSEPRMGMARSPVRPQHSARTRRGRKPTNGS